MLRLKTTAYQEIQIFSNRRVISQKRSFSQTCQSILQRSTVNRLRSAYEDLLILGLGQTFLFREQFFVKLLARTHSDELDIYIGTGAKTGAANQVSGQLKDFDRLAHIQNEDLATIAQSTSLQNQLNRFRYQHEITGSFWMGDGDWTTLGNLLLPQRNDRTATGKNIPESNCDEFSARNAGKVLDYQLRSTL